MDIFIRFDIIIGGLYPYPIDYGLFEKSITYHQDELIWCVQRAQIIPKLLNSLQIFSVEVWILNTVCSYFLCTGLLYLLIQFDHEYERKNLLDINYALFLIVVPTHIGQYPRFFPKKRYIRFFFAFILLIPQIFHAMHGAFIYRYMKVDFFYHQVSTVDEILNNEFRLTGSYEFLNALKSNAIVSKIQLIICNFVLSFKFKCNLLFVVFANKFGAICCMHDYREMFKTIETEIKFEFSDWRLTTTHI